MKADYYPGPAFDVLGKLRAAEAEVSRLRAVVARVEALFAGGPDTPCRTTWLRDEWSGLEIECVEVPMDDLRAALGGDA